MLNKLIKKIWQITPRVLRLKAVRLTQNKFTASVAAVVINENREVLLLKHLMRPFHSWGFPGGFMEHGESPEEAIRREICEETGLELKNIEIVRVRTIKTHLEIIFRAEAGGKPEAKSREITDAQWFKSNEMPEDMSRKQKAMAEEIMNSGSD